MIHKYRAWHKPTNIMLDVIAINLSLRGITAKIETRKIYPELDYWWKETDIPFSEIVLMQYTGLKDRHGKEIYEGDILKWDRELVLFSPTNTELVSMDFPRLPIMKSPKWIFFDTYYSEVLGNIHENPELEVEG